MKKFIVPMAIAAAISTSNLFAAKDYIIQITEKDGTVRQIPVSSLEKVTFETASSTTIELNDPKKAFDERFGTEKIRATQYKVPSKVAEKMVKEYHAKSLKHKHSI
ncbi:MAG: hypothetical protein HUK19_00990 [Fibrobacter sp.]|nr:hypothetical protein [Fibrobacter sp.]